MRRFARHLSPFRHVRHFSYANVAATLALVLSMGGVSVAATHYLIHSTHQISPKVLRALKGRSGSRGALGPEGPQGQLGPQGQRGVEGRTGPEGVSSLSTLPSGRSESGVYGLRPDGGEAVANGTMGESVTFALALEKDIPEERVVYNDVATTSTHCAGPGHAATGYLCLYSSAHNGVATPAVIVDPEVATLSAGAGRRGFVVEWTLTGAGAYDFGTYTVGN
jgi:hypothetical protein